MPTAKGIYYSLFVFAIVTTWSVNAEKVDYCKLDSCPGGSHTMCKYKSPKPSKNCYNFETNALASNEIQIILEKHNKLREHVASGKEKRGKPGPQPSASNLGPLQWDKELADIAQRWANQCILQHDSCRNVEKFLVGQNIAIRSKTGKNDIPLDEMIQMWYNEVDFFDRRQIPKLQNIGKAGHYGQLIWADTKYVGCGVVKYITPNKWSNTLLVCNYGPAGNVIGRSVYKTK